MRVVRKVLESGKAGESQRLIEEKNGRKLQVGQIYIGYMSAMGTFRFRGVN